MTVKEAIYAELMDIPVSDLACYKAVEDEGLLTNVLLLRRTVYVPKVHKKAVAMVVRVLLKSVLSNPDIVEGGFSIKQHRASILSRIRAIEKEYTIETPSQNVPSLSMVQRW